MMFAEWYDLAKPSTPRATARQVWEAAQMAMRERAIDAATVAGVESIVDAVTLSPVLAAIEALPIE